MKLVDIALFPLTVSYAIIMTLLDLVAGSWSDSTESTQSPLMHPPSSPAAPLRPTTPSLPPPALPPLLSSAPPALALSTPLPPSDTPSPATTPSPPPSPVFSLPASSAMSRTATEGTSMSSAAGLPKPSAPAPSISEGEGEGEKGIEEPQAVAENEAGGRFPVGATLYVIKNLDELQRKAGEVPGLKKLVQGVGQLKLGVFCPELDEEDEYFYAFGDTEDHQFRNFCAELYSSSSIQVLDYPVKYLKMLELAAQHDTTLISLPTTPPLLRELTPNQERTGEFRTSRIPALISDQHASTFHSSSTTFTYTAPNTSPIPLLHSFIGLKLNGSGGAKESDHGARTGTLSVQSSLGGKTATLLAVGIQLKQAKLLTTLNMDMPNTIKPPAEEKKVDEIGKPTRSAGLNVGEKPSFSFTRVSGGGKVGTEVTYRHDSTVTAYPTRVDDPLDCSFDCYLRQPDHGPKLDLDSIDITYRLGIREHGDKASFAAETASVFYVPRSPVVISPNNLVYRLFHKLTMLDLESSESTGSEWVATMPVAEGTKDLALGFSLQKGVTDTEVRSAVRVHQTLFEQQQEERTLKERICHPTPGELVEDGIAVAEDQIAYC